MPVASLFRRRGGPRDEPAEVAVRVLRGILLLRRFATLCCSLSLDTRLRIHAGCDLLVYCFPLRQPLHVERGSGRQESTKFKAVAAWYNRVAEVAQKHRTKTSHVTLLTSHFRTDLRSTDDCRMFVVFPCSPSVFTRCRLPGTEVSCRRCHGSNTLVMDYRMHEGRLLPPGWVKCQSSTYAPHIYFFDTQTNTSRWDPPSPLTRSPSASPPSAKRHRPSSDNDEVARDDEGRRLKIAVIVPYRDLEPAQQRARHLQQFVPHMKAFMSRLGVAFRLYVVEQSADGRKFNRGKLLNIGFDLARREGHDVFIFHDVDLLPSHELGR